MNSNLPEILVIGEILYDIFPTYKRLGGAPFNFAYHLKKLGLPVRFISRVGNDLDGKEILAFLEKNGFDPKDIAIDSDHPTGRVEIHMDASGNHEFNILENVAYDFMEIDEQLATAISRSIQLIYYGTLIQRTPQGAASIQKALNLCRPETQILYDINLRPNCYQDAIVATSLRKADILKLNVDELDTLKKMHHQEQDAPDFMRSLLEQYHLQWIVLTKGGNGSEFYTPESFFKTEGVSIEHLVDSVGAGDAFAAILALGAVLSWPPSSILETASWFAAQICQEQGALPSNAQAYETILERIKSI